MGRRQEWLRGHDRSPIAGRTGEGPPFCPPGWTWRTGNRVQDMYFTAPGPHGGKFRSKTELKAYLDKLEKAPDISQFMWKIAPDFFKDNPLPGVAIVLRQRGANLLKDGNKRKAEEELEKSRLTKLKDAARKAIMVSSQFSSEPKIEAQLHTSLPFLSPHQSDHKSLVEVSTPVDAAAADTAPVTVKRKRGRPPSAVDDHTFNSILSTVTSYKWLLDTSEDLRRFMEEAGRLEQRSEDEINEYRRLLLSRTHDTISMRRYSKPVLRVFVRILRNEEVPESLERGELAGLCCSWKCKHKRYTCLLEETRIQALKGVEMEKDTVAMAMSRVAATEPSEHPLPRLPPNGAQAQVYAVSRVTDAAHERATLSEDDMQRQAGAEVFGFRDMLIGQHAITSSRKMRGSSAPRTSACFCKACSGEADFCRGCMCSLCNSTASTTEAWQVLKCCSCDHLFHLECAVNTKCAGVVKDSDLDVEFFCPLCNCKMDLFPFWRDRLFSAIASKDVISLEKHITSAVLVLKGTQKYSSLHKLMEEAYHVLLAGSNYPEVYSRLQQIEDELDASGVNQLQLTEDNAFLMDAQQSERELIDAEVRVSQLQHKADADHEEWSEAEKVAEGSRIRFVEAQERWRAATQAAKVKCDNAAASRLILHKGKQRLAALRERTEPMIFSSAELEAKHGKMQEETLELQSLEDRVRQLDSVLDAAELADLLERVAIQQIRVQVARSRLEKLLSAGESSS